MKAQMSACPIPSIPTGTRPEKIARIRLSINEAGKLTGESSSTPASSSDWLRATGPLRNCKFAPYLVQGVPSYYKGDIEVLLP